MERIITFQNKHWEGNLYEGLHKRKLLNTAISKIGLPHIQAFTGIRRCGKSTMFKLIINYLIENSVHPKSILFINVDDPMFHSTWQDSAKIYSIIDLAQKITQTKFDYLFLDEIQSVQNWESFVKSIYDSGLFRKIFVTGSNSSLLASNYATLLSGRYLTDQVYPYSFEEIFEINNIKSYHEFILQKPKVMQLTEHGMHRGFFPEIQAINNSTLERQVLLAYFESITTKDCIVRHGIRDSKLFKEFVIYLFNTVATVFSVNSLAKVLNSNENTIKSYLHILTDSYLFYEIQNFSFSPKPNARLKSKVYCVDTGMLSAVANFHSPNLGRLFENLVFCELLKIAGVKISFFNDENECDFIVNYNNKTIAIQAVYELNNTNKNRELAGLTTVKEKFGITELLLVSYSQTELSDDYSTIQIGALFNYFKKYE